MERPTLLFSVLVMKYALNKYDCDPVERRAQPAASTSAWRASVQDTVSVPTVT